MNNTEQRFWSQVDKSGECWKWTGILTPDGYGRFCTKLHGTTTWKAHRYSWLLHLGPIPKDRLVCHSCDDPSCVNPDHLWLGTTVQNQHDKARKGRQAQGEAHGSAKLNVVKVIQIRQSNKPDSYWARKFNVHETTIYYARTGRKWRHVEMARDC